MVENFAAVLGVAELKIAFSFAVLVYFSCARFISSGRENCQECMRKLDDGHLEYTVVKVPGLPCGLSAKGCEAVCKHQ